MLYISRIEIERRNDMTLYRESNLDNKVRHALFIDGVQYLDFDDAAYMLCPWMQTTYSRLQSSVVEVL